MPRRRFLRSERVRDTPSGPGSRALCAAARDARPAASPAASPSTRRTAPRPPTAGWTREPRTATPSPNRAHAWLSRGPRHSRAPACQAVAQAGPASGAAVDNTCHRRRHVRERLTPRGRQGEGRVGRQRAQAPATGQAGILEGEEDRSERRGRLAWKNATSGGRKLLVGVKRRPGGCVVDQEGPRARSACDSGQMKK